MRIPKGGIGFFDSGIGGLTVLATCEKCFTDGVFYYYGDNKHAPYGNLPPEKIKKYVLKVFEKFRRLKVRAAVIACNTATAVCVEELRKKYSFPIVGAEPAVCKAAAKGGRVLVLTTRATFESERFRCLCERAKKLFPKANILPVPCDCLAGEIERNLTVKDFDYTPFLPQASPDAVVLGCTHYVYIEEQIRAYYGCEVYHGNEGMARRLHALLEKNRKENRDERPQNENLCLLLGLVTTPDSNSSPKEENTSKKSKNHQKTIEGVKIFFIGNAKKCNKLTHEQMFECDFGTNK